ncbi:MAG: DNA topoisomerase 4 subunit A [Alphaproteobacteria bacterium ADurb.Bin438]|nr:MAG: DNA topoisomerase 4 subunit A [Alphaproteobacteria bacterium ADurb.Bin438]
MEVFGLTDNQAEAILNMKLRSLRKLEEVQINSEHRNLSEEKLELQKILNEEALRYEKISEDFQNLKKKYQKDKRRTTFGDVPVIEDITEEETTIEKEAITVAYSKKGWIRAVKGFVNAADLKFKDDDELLLSLHCYTTDKINLFGTNGRFYTVIADKISRGRGFGEAIRFLIDLPPESEILNMFAHNDDDLYLLASFTGRGFAVKASDILSQTKGGKIVMSFKDDDYPLYCELMDKDMIAFVGQNRKMLVFETKNIPIIAKGQGVILQKYDIGGMSDMKMFNMSDGLSYININGDEKIIKDISPWLSKRATKGSILMPTFKRNNKFE